MRTYTAVDRLFLRHITKPPRSYHRQFRLVDLWSKAFLTWHVIWFRSIFLIVQCMFLDIYSYTHLNFWQFCLPHKMITHVIFLTSASFLKMGAYLYTFMERRLEWNSLNIFFWFCQYMPFLIVVFINTLVMTCIALACFIFNSHSFLIQQNDLQLVSTISLLHEWYKCAQGCPSSQIKLLIQLIKTFVFHWSKKGNPVNCVCVLFSVQYVSVVLTMLCRFTLKDHTVKCLFSLKMKPEIKGAIYSWSEIIKKLFLS